jgi:hypothetical protein
MHIIIYKISHFYEHIYIYIIFINILDILRFIKLVKKYYLLLKNN